MHVICVFLIITCCFIGWLGKSTFVSQCYKKNTWMQFYTTNALLGNPIKKKTNVEKSAQHKPIKKIKLMKIYQIIEN